MPKVTWCWLNRFSAKFSMRRSRCCCRLWFRHFRPSSFRRPAIRPVCYKWFLEMISATPARLHCFDWAQHFRWIQATATKRYWSRRQFAAFDVSCWKHAPHRTASALVSRPIVSAPYYANGESKCCRSCRLFRCSPSSRSFALCRAMGTALATERLAMSADSANFHAPKWSKIMFGQPIYERPDENRHINHSDEQINTSIICRSAECAMFLGNLAKLFDLRSPLMIVCLGFGWNSPKCSTGDEHKKDFSLAFTVYSSHCAALTINPTAVSEIFNSCVWEPNLAAVFMHIGKHRQGITGKKSVTTSCKHWNAIRISASPWRSLTAPMIPSTSGQPCVNVSPPPLSTCSTHSSWRCLTSPCGTDDSSANGFSKSVWRF